MVWMWTSPLSGFALADWGAPSAGQCYPVYNFSVSLVMEAKRTSQDGHKPSQKVINTTAGKRNRKPTKRRCPKGIFSTKDECTCQSVIDDIDGVAFHINEGHWSCTFSDVFIQREDARKQQRSPVRSWLEHPRKKALPIWRVRESV
ncbi:hypothetical protein EDB19DRAFT_2030452 [Suillus lakei]|nr:hypothetical protein EDB19DRAFT_2030452 [Suillus lakei]